jgi:hypothetical protein
LVKYLEDSRGKEVEMERVVKERWRLEELGLEEGTEEVGTEEGSLVGEGLA